MSFHLDTLPNGLRIASEHLPHVHSAAFAVAVNVGARYADAADGGISHLLEHMAFKGTPRLSAQAIAETFDLMGGNVNAYTSHEHTVYYAKVLKEYADDALALLLEIVRDSHFEEAELERERQVILQEIAMHEDSPDDLVFDLFQETAFANQPLGRSILGTPKRVASFSREDLVRYTAQHYVPNRMVIAAAGAIDHAAVCKRAEAMLGDKTLPAQPATMQTARYTGGVHLREKELEQVQFALGFEGCASGHADYYALQLFSTILGGGMSSRLFQEIREKRGLAYSVSSYVAGYQDTGLLGIYAGTNASQLPSLMAGLHEVLGSMQEGVTAQELLRAKNQMKASIVMTRESVGSIAEWMARHLHVYGRYKMAEEILAAIDAVSADDMVRMAQHYLGATRVPTLTVLGEVADFHAEEAQRALCA